MPNVDIVNPSYEKYMHKYIAIDINTRYGNQQPEGDI